MEKIIKLLNEYWATHEAECDDGGMRFFENPEKDGSDMMNEIWNTCFVGQGWNPAMVRILHENGYAIRVFERDSFGILVAGIGKEGKWLSIG